MSGATCGVGRDAKTPDIATLIRATFQNPRYHPTMVNYRRNFLDGGTYFFTVTLADRRSTVLIDHIGALRAAFRTARQERPFTIDAVVILPDHLHVIITLPQGDTDFAGRWRRVKGYSAPTCLMRALPSNAMRMASLLYGKGDSGSTQSVTMATLPGT